MKYQSKTSQTKREQAIDFWLDNLTEAERMEVANLQDQLERNLAAKADGENRKRQFFGAKSSLELVFCLWAFLTKPGSVKSTTMRDKGA